MQRTGGLTTMHWPRKFCRSSQIHFFVMFIVSRAGFAGAAVDRLAETKGVCVPRLDPETLIKHSNRLMRGANTRGTERESMVCTLVTAFFPAPDTKLLLAREQIQENFTENVYVETYTPERVY